MNKTLATVITNLVSTIPVFGKDIVELIWGGLNQLKTEEPYNSDIVLQMQLIARTAPNLRIRYSHSLTMVVKKLIIRRKPAGIRYNSYIEVPQRLNAVELKKAMLVGFVEGDGWFSVSKKGKYLMYEFGIELSIRDVQLIYKFKEFLGIGTVKFRNTEGRSKTVIYRVRKKSHLKAVILPIFDSYPLLSNKQYDYLRFRDALLKGIIFFDNLDSNDIRPTISLNTVDSILSVPYFTSWLVGFIEAEGCFSIYQPINSISKVASFDIAQTNESNLILAISKYLSFTQKVHKDKTNCFKLKVSSVRSVENIIKFMEKAPVKLMGHKKLQYFLWLKELRQIPRYTKKISIPDIY